MGCQCANSNLKDNQEIKRQDLEKIALNKEIISNSQPNILPLEENNFLIDNKLDLRNRSNNNIFGDEYKHNQILNKYDDYPEKMLEIINKIREDPKSYADFVENEIENIINNHDKDSPNKNKIIYKKKVKVALTRGEPAFREAVERLNTTSPLPPLKFLEDICIPLPETKEEIMDTNFLREQVKKLREKSSIDVFFKDLVKVPEVSALLMVVDDTGKNAGKKVKALLNPSYKYIGISSKFIGKIFVAYFSFAESIKYN